MPYDHSTLSHYGSEPAVNRCWGKIENTLAREIGLPFLGRYKHEDPLSGCLDFISSCSADNVLDALEVSFGYMAALNERTNLDGSQSLDDAISELNHRLDEHQIGYQLLNGRIVRRDSEYIHAEVVVPALSLLHISGFTGAEQEFMRAHEHFRNRKYEECMGEALKAFESTMKSILQIRKWPFQKSDSAKALLDQLYAKHLIPAALQSHLTGLRSALESGLPTLSNKSARHGQGLAPRETPAHYAGFCLHLTAANIHFLIECHRAKQ